MITSGDDELGVGHSLRDDFKSIDQLLQPLVGPPFAESENALRRIVAAGKVGILGSARENTVSPNVDVLATIFFTQSAAVSMHEHGNGVRHQHNASGH